MIQLEQSMIKPMNVLFVVLVMVESSLSEMWTLFMLPWTVLRATTIDWMNLSLVTKSMQKSIPKNSL